jgi:TolA-binding protein
VKILAKFLLSGVFVFLSAAGVVPLSAQHYRGESPSSWRELQDYDIAGIKSDEQKAIQDLQTRCQKLEDDFQDMHLTIEYQPELILDNSKRIKSIESSLDLMEEKLRTAESEIQELKEELTFYSPLPPHPASRKAAANKPSGFIPDTPATTPNPASKKSDASKLKAPPSKPTAPVIKPKPAVKEDTH